LVKVRQEPEKTRKEDPAVSGRLISPPKALPKYSDIPSKFGKFLSKRFNV